MKTKIKSMSKRTLSILLVLLMVLSTVTVGIITTTAAYIEPDSEIVGASADDSVGASADDSVGVSVDADEAVGDISFSNFYIHGSWDNEDREVTQNVAYEKELSAGTTYTFYFRGKSGSTYYDFKKNGTTISSTTDYNITTGEASALNLTTGIAGTYKFYYKSIGGGGTSMTIRVEFPEGATTWTVAGNNTNLFGSSYLPNISANDMTESPTGTFTWSKNNVYIAAGDLEYKVAKNHTWSGCYPSGNGHQTETISTAGYKNVTITWIPASNSLTISVTDAVTYTLEVPANVSDATVTATYNGTTVQEGETLTGIPQGATVNIRVDTILGKKCTGVTSTPSASISGSKKDWTLTMPGANVTNLTFAIDDDDLKKVYFNNGNTMYPMVTAYGKNASGEDTLGASGQTMTKLANSNIWVIEVPATTATIEFIGNSGKTGDLTIPWNDYDPPKYTPGTNPASPKTGGTWGKYIERTNEYTVTAGSTLSNTVNPNLFTGISATLYDYYVDGEIEGTGSWLTGIRDDDKNSNPKKYREFSVQDGTKFQWNPYTTLNQALSGYASTHGVTYPLYFGNLNTVNITDNGVKDYGSNNGMKTTIEGYTNWSNSTLANCSVFLGDGKSHDAVTGLSGTTLAKSNIHYYKNDASNENGAFMAMFDEDFLSGENTQSKTLATILRTSAFPVRKTRIGGTIAYDDKIYMTPNRWAKDNAVIFAHFYNDDGSLYDDHMLTTVGDYLVTDRPSYATKVIFVRMKPGSTSIAWEPGSNWGKSSAYNVETSTSSASRLYVNSNDGEWSNDFSKEDIPQDYSHPVGDSGHEYYEFNSRGGIDNAFIENINTTSKTATIEYYNQSTGNYVYSENPTIGKQVGFLPFDKDAMNSHIGDTAHDLGFGMKLEIPFTINAGGEFADDNSAQVFNFSGDDDLWVFIDDKLVLDLGGAHERTEGSINFKTCEVTASNKQAIVAGVDRNGKFGKGETNGWFDNSNPNIPHTMTIYYMERGMFDSNLKFGFSFHAIPNQFKAEKKIRTYEINKGFYDDNGKTGAASNKSESLSIREDRFITKFEETYQSDKFEVEHKVGDTLINGKQYTITGADGSSDTATSNGTYQIKNDDIAYFLAKFAADDLFTLKETPVTGNLYNYTPDIEIHDDGNNSKIFTKADNPNDLQVGEWKGNAEDGWTFKFSETHPTGLENLNIRARFLNHMKSHTLTLKKAVNGNFNPNDTFTLELLFQFGAETNPADNPYISYPLECTVYNADGTVDSTAAPALNGDGQITIKPGQSISLPKIPENARMRIRELLKDETSEYSYVGVTAPNADNLTALDAADGKGATFKMGTQDVVATVTNLQGSLSITHDLKDGSIGSALCFASAVVKKNGTAVKTYSKTTGSVDIDPLYIKKGAGFTIEITLDTEPADDYALENFYEEITGTMKQLAQDGIIRSATIDVANNTATFTVNVDDLFTASSQQYTLLPFYSNLEEATGNFTITKAILDGRTSTESYDIYINTREALDSASSTAYQGRYVIVHTDSSVTKVPAATRSECVVSLKQGEQIQIRVKDDTFFEITEKAADATYKRLYHYMNTKVDGTEVTASTSEILKINQGVALKVTSAEKAVVINNKAWGYKIEYSYPGYLERYGVISPGGQKYTVSNLFTADEYYDYLQFSELTDSDSGKTVYGVTFKTDELKRNFITSKAPFQDNFMQKLVWDPVFSGDKQNTDSYYYGEHVGEEVELQTKSVNSTDKTIQIFFEFPYETTVTPTSITPVKSDGKVLKQDTDIVNVNTQYSYWFTFNNEYDDQEAADFVTAPPEIYLKSGDIYTKYVFRYWSMKTVNTQGTASHSRRLIKEEYKRCYNNKFNMTFYQDSYIEPIYAEDGTEGTELTPKQLEARDTSGGNYTNITFLENSRNQWNNNGGTEQEDKSRRLQGDRVYCDFLLSFGYNDIMLRSSLNKKKTVTKKDESGNNIEVVTYVPFLLNGANIFHSAGVVIERVAEIEDKNQDGKITSDDILTQQEYIGKYGSDNSAATAFINSKQSSSGNFLINEAFSTGGFDNKNQYEYSTSFANRSHVNLSETIHKKYVYRAYTYLRDYDGSTATTANCQWGGTSASEADINKIKQHNGALIKVSEPVYFTIYQMATVQNGSNEDGGGES